MQEYEAVYKSENELKGMQRINVSKYNIKYNFFTSSIVPLCSIIMNTQKTKNKIIFNDVSKLYSQYYTFWIPISYTFI